LDENLHRDVQGVQVSLYELHKAVAGASGADIDWLAVAASMGHSESGAALAPRLEALYDATLRRFTESVGGGASACPFVCPSSQPAETLLGGVCPLTCQPAMP
jgi:hypothetical protein